MSYEMQEKALPAPAYNAYGSQQHVPTQAPMPQQQYAPQPQPMVMSPPQQIVYTPAATMQPYAQEGPPPASLNAYPASVKCPHCNKTGISRVEYEAGTKTHIWAVVSGVCCLMCCVPYLINGTKDCSHFCSHCGAHLITWQR
ncbi:hypothetical protein EXIGLDRAFT_836165 [Exidia glandulosa HHB12029]|uniref:LITAF domain-containing protein n=1 Tax=Exidia glandulosa HHB12029 TaxID=1314781 RepID=A0A165I2P6_EXIGL|nr:hypothetical protein EXIGLDRAFT_836165 [Exidia glandulosa HHB12029]